MSYRASLIVCAVLVQAASCGGTSPGEQFCNDWAAAFCEKVYTCTPAADRGANFPGGSSEAQCKQIWSTFCSTKPPAGVTVDLNCSDGQHVNTAARTACFNELSTISCTDFNSPTYDSVCNQVCTQAADAGSGSDSGSGGSAGGGSGGSAGGGSGGSAGGGSCGKVQPCGGDVVGNWKLTNECVDLATLQPQAQGACAQASITNASINPSGNLAFGANMSFSISGTATVVLDWHFPLPCLAGATCGAFGSMLSQGLTAGQTFTCTGTSDCDCKQAALIDMTDSGTYGVTGTNLVLSSSVSGKTSTGGYCVQGSALHLVAVGASMTISSDTVAERQ